MLHINLIFLGILKNIPAERSLCRNGLPVDDTKIIFFDLPLLDLLVHDPQGFRVFRGDHDAAGVAVNAVAQGRGKGMLFFGPPFALLIGIRLNICDQGVIIPLPGAVA